VVNKSEVSQDDIDEVHDEQTVLHNITQLKTMSVNASPEYLQALSHLIHQKDREWVNQFVKDGAVKLLGDILQKNESKFKTLKQNTIQEHCIACLKAIGDSEVFHGFLKNKKTVNSIALLLDMKCRSANNYVMKSGIYELLSLLCTYSEDGFWCALDAMTAYKTAKKEDQRFTDLVEILSQKNRSEQKVSTLTKLTRTVKEIPLEVKQDMQAYALLFINALINSPKDQSTRAFVREEFKRLGATTMVEDIRGEIEKKQITSSKLIAQVKVFEEEMLGSILEQSESDDEAEHSEEEEGDRAQDDEQGASAEDVNIDDILKTLRLKLGNTTGGVVRLNEVMRSLLKLIQSSDKDTVKEASLKSISDLVNHLVDQSINREEKGQVDDILVEISNLQKRIKLLEKERELSKSTENLLDKLVEEKENVLNENVTVKSELKSAQESIQKLTVEREQLQEQLQKLQSDVIISTKDDSEQVSQLRSEIETLRQEAQQKEQLVIKKLESEIASKIEGQLSLIEKAGADIPQINMPQLNSLNVLDKSINNIMYKHFLEMEKLKDKLQEGFESEINSNSSSGDNKNEDTIISQLRLEVKMLKQQRNTILKKLEEGNGSNNSQEISKLKEEVERLRRELQNRPVSSGVPPPPPSSTNGELGTDVVTTDVPPPPPMNGGPPPPPPPPMMGSGGPPPPPPMMGSDGPPPPPPMNGGPPPPPMMGGGPPPPGPPMMGMVKGPVLPSLPSIGTPSKQMKNFHCDTIAKNKVADTIWVKGGIIDEIKDIQIDVSEIEDLFSNEATKRETTDSAEEPKKQKKELVSFVDPQKATNIALLLGYMRMSPNDIRDAIVNMDEEKLSQGNIDALKDKAPSPDEIESLCAYTGEKELLAPTDQFYLAIKDIPRLTARLNCWAFKYKFGNDIAQILPDVDSLTLAVTEVIDSTRFKRFLSVVLAVTNFLNAKSAKKDSYGFKLKSLLKLGDTKSAKNNMSLLQYIAVYCEKNDADLLELGNDIPHLEAATRVSLPDVTNEVKKLQTGVKLVEQEIAEYDENSNDRFVKVMRDFLNDAQDQLNDITAALMNLEEQLSALVTSYAEDTAIVKNPTEFLQLLKRFFGQYQEAYKTYLRKMEQEQKKQKQALLAESMKQKLEQKQQLQLSATHTLQVEKSSERSTSIMDGSAFRTRRYSRLEQKQAPQQEYVMPTLKKTGKNLQ
jgi:diaphanous 1